MVNQAAFNDPYDLQMTSDGAQVFIKSTTI